MTWMEGTSDDSKGQMVIDNGGRVRITKGAGWESPGATRGSVSPGEY